MLHATDAPGYSINIWLYKFLSVNQIKRSVAMLYHLAMKNLHLVKVHGIFCNFESGSTFVVVHIERVLNCLWARTELVSTCAECAYVGSVENVATTSCVC